MICFLIVVLLKDDVLLVLYLEHFTLLTPLGRFTLLGIDKGSHFHLLSTLTRSRGLFLSAFNHRTDLQTEIGHN